MAFSKLKVGFLAGASFICIHTANAAGLQGFYAGATLGGNIAVDKYSYTNSRTGANAINQDGRNASFPISLGIMGGYNHLINSCFMLGGELFIDGYIGSRQSTIKGDTLTLKANRVGPAYGFLVRAGFMAYPKVLVYAGLGGKFTKSKYTLISNTATTSGIEASVSKRTFKPLVEVGMEGMFSNNHLGWRASYNCAFGRSVKMGNFPANHILNQAGDTPSASFSSTEHGIKLGVFYRF